VDFKTLLEIGERKMEKPTAVQILSGNHPLSKGFYLWVKRKEVTYQTKRQARKYLAKITRQGVFTVH